MGTLAGVNALQRSDATGESQPAGEPSAAETSEPVAVLRSSLLASAEGLVHGFSTRHGGVSRVYRPALPDGMGDLNLGFTADDAPTAVRENRRRFLRAVGADRMNRFALLRQEHTAVVHALRNPQKLSDNFGELGRMRGDGLVTDQPGVLLAVGTADCIPVLVFDPSRRVVAAFHAGWRGTLARIVQIGVDRMRQQYESKPEDLLAVIGPGIGPASYTVSAALQTDFAAEFGYADDLFYQDTPANGPRRRLNLWEANRRQLLDAGLRPERIDLLGHDTAADTALFFSHRAEAGFTGRMLSVIGLTD